MSKKLFLTLVCLFSVTFAYAQKSSTETYDTPYKDIKREAAMVQVLWSKHNAFNKMKLVDILQTAYEWVAHSKKAAGWWGTGSINSGQTGHKNLLKNILKDWKDRTENAWEELKRNPDALELAHMTDRLARGDKQYFSARHGANILENVYEKNAELSTADQLAFKKDFNVMSGTSSMGSSFYVKRGATYIGKYNQVRIVTRGKAFNLYVQAKQTPIVLDLDGDGRLEASNGVWLPHQLALKDSKDAEKLVSFDMNGDGFAEMTEWVGPNDGLLITYVEGEKVSAKNLYGNEGGKYQHGYEKLSLLDMNLDRKLTGAELRTLSVWQDKNGDAKVDAGEISSLTSLGITELRLNHKNCVSHFIQNGARKAMWDWFPVTFEVKKQKLD
jgi:hypothetical protein